MNSALMLHRHASPAVAGSYTSGAVLGACTTVAGLFVAGGLLSPVPSGLRAGLALCMLLLLGLHASGVLCLDLPQRSYQIPRETFTALPSRAAFRFAYELGTGVRTYITATSPYALAIVVLLALPAGLAPATWAALAAAVGYGLGRSLVVSAQALRAAVAVDHPKMWLSGADHVALATAIALTISLLAASPQS